MNSQPNTRRTFLRGAALTSVGVAVPVPKLAARAAPQGRFSQLDDDSRASLEFLLDKLDQQGITLDHEVVAGCLAGADMVVKGRERDEAEARGHQEYMEQRDGLSGQARISFVVETLKKDVSLYVPAFQRTMLNRVAKGEPSGPVWRHSKNIGAYAIGRTNQLLEGCTDGFKQEVIDQYLETVLPQQEAEQAKDEAREDAIQEFVDLIGDKTASEVKKMTAQLKAVLS